MAGTSSDSLATHKKFIISTIAIFVCAVIIGNFFESTKPVSSTIFHVQYPVGDASAATMYGCGPADGITILFYVALALIVTSCIEDLIESMKLSQTDDFSQQMTQILFYISSFLFGIYVLSKGGYDWETLINGLPDHNVPFLMKAFYIYQLGFLLQCVPQAMLQGLSPPECLTSLVEVEVLVLFLGITYALNFTPVATVVLMSHYAANLLFQLAVISSDSRSFKSSMKYALFAAEHILTLGAAVCICMYGDSRGQPLRYLAVGVAVAWAILSGQAMYKDPANDSKASSGLALLPTASGSRKTRKRSKSKSRKGNGDRRSSRRRR